MKRLFFAFAATASLANAQSASGTLTGLVTDSTQAAVPGVVLKLTNIDTGVAATATTNQGGEYTFPLLAVGR